MTKTGKFKNGLFLINLNGELPAKNFIDLQSTNAEFEKITATLTDMLRKTGLIEIKVAPNILKPDNKKIDASIITTTLPIAKQINSILTNSLTMSSFLSAYVANERLTKCGNSVCGEICTQEQMKSCEILKKMNFVLEFVKTYDLYESEVDHFIATNSANKNGEG